MQTAASSLRGTLSPAIDTAVPEAQFVGWWRRQPAGWSCCAGKHTRTCAYLQALILVFAPRSPEGYRGAAGGQLLARGGSVVDSSPCLHAGGPLERHNSVVVGPWEFIIRQDRERRMALQRCVEASALPVLCAGVIDGFQRTHSIREGDAGIETDGEVGVRPLPSEWEAWRGAEVMTEIPRDAPRANFRHHFGASSSPSSGVSHDIHSHDGIATST